MLHQPIESLKLYVLMQNTFEQTMVNVMGISKGANSAFERFIKRYIYYNSYP